MITAVWVRSQRCLAVQAVPDKTNEMMAVRQLIDRSDLEDCLVEMDALNIHEEIVQKLLHQKRG